MAIVEGKVIFDETEQSEVNRIVEERLSRERGKYQGYDDYKGIEEELKAFGYEGTPSEIRSAIKAQREETVRQQELQELQEQAKNEGTSPQLLAEMRELKKELSEIKGERQAIKQAEEESKTKATYYNQQKELLLEKHNINADKLSENAKFMKFVKGKTISDLVETYEDFIDFIGEAESESIKKVMSKEMRSTSGGKGTNSGGNYGLTDSQKALVDEWNEENPGMKTSYKEFSEKL